MPVAPEPAPTVQQLLAFYLEAGVDCALTDEPVNRLADPDVAPAPSKTEPREVVVPRTLMQQPAPVPAPRADVMITPEVAISSAREAARTAPTLEALRALLENFDGCALKHTATRLRIAVGEHQACIMFVGEEIGRAHV